MLGTFTPSTGIKMRVNIALPACDCSQVGVLRDEINLIDVAFKERRAPGRSSIRSEVDPELSPPVIPTVTKPGNDPSAFLSSRKLNSGADCSAAGAGVVGSCTSPAGSVASTTSVVATCGVSSGKSVKSSPGASVTEGATAAVVVVRVGAGVVVDSDADSEVVTAITSSKSSAESTTMCPSCVQWQVTWLGPDMLLRHPPVSYIAPFQRTHLAPVKASPVPGQNLSAVTGKVICTGSDVSVMSNLPSMPSRTLTMGDRGCTELLGAL
eukprot:2532635-Rhodomonas_salina.1